MTRDTSALGYARSRKFSGARHLRRLARTHVVRCVAVATIAAANFAGAQTSAGVFALQRLELATSGAVGQPSVAVEPIDGFVVTWQERAGERAALWHAVIDLQGRELRRGKIASRTNWFVNWADFPSLVVLDNGDWVTHWLEKSAGSTYAYDVRLVRSVDRGRTWSAPVTPHRDGTRTQHGFVSLVPHRNDEVLVVWLDGRRGAESAAEAGAHAHEEDEGPMTLRSAIVNRSGARREERELDASTCSCCQTDAVRVGDRSMVVYRDRSSAEIRDIAFMTRSGAGAWSTPALVHADQWRTSPAIRSSGSSTMCVVPSRYAFLSW
jgi:hypothetical protein